MIELLEINVCAPEELEISEDMRNEKIIAEWWKRVALYVRYMQSLGRVAMIHFDNEGRFYLSSVPAKVESTRA